MGAPHKRPAGKKNKGIKPGSEVRGAAESHQCGQTRSQHKFSNVRRFLLSPKEPPRSSTGCEGPRRGMWHYRVCIIAPLGNVCPCPGGCAFFDSGQRHLPASSKAHKFVCELRARLRNRYAFGKRRAKLEATLGSKRARRRPRHCGGSF